MELTHTFSWLVGADENLNCEICRTCGTWMSDKDHLTVIITPGMAASLIETLKSNQNVACTIANALTMESYQLKGVYIDDRALSQDEERIKEDYMQGMKKVLGDMGFNYGDSFRKYADMEGRAITMKVHEIFEQTPRKGAGAKIILKENES